jgi:hypothetical protein
MLGAQIEKLPADSELPPSNATMRFGGSPDPGCASPEYVRGFASFCARSSLIDMMGACERYLRNLWLIARLVELVETNGLITVPEYLALRDCSDKDRSGLWDLFDAVLVTGGIKRQSVGGRRWFTSLDLLRNCLVHRGGLVGSADTNKRGVLKTTWRGVILIAPEGEVISSLPYLSSHGGELKIVTKDRLREWTLGEHLNITAADCQEMAFSLSIFCDQLRVQLLRRSSKVLSRFSDGGDAGAERNQKI